MRWLALLLLLGAAPVAAQDLRPQARPVIEARNPDIPADLRPVARLSTKAAPALQLAPVPRPENIATDRIANSRPVARTVQRPELAYGAQTRPIFRADQDLFAFDPNLLRVSLRPNDRPAAIVARAVEQRLARQRGAVCGDVAIQGETLGNVAGSGACGVENAVRVRSVAGVTLRPAATMDCRTASALKAWVAQGARPATAQLGGGISSLRVVSHYACRNRNNAANGRLSEHSFGRAIDIAGIGLRNGVEVTVLTDWGRGAKGEALRRMWRAACGPFGTVLGPEANRFHRDHFHFDTARYRSGSYCR